MKTSYIFCIGLWNLTKANIFVCIGKNLKKPYNFFGYRGAELNKT